MKVLSISTLALLVAAPMAMAQSSDGSITAEDFGIGMDSDTTQTSEAGTDMADPAMLIRTRVITGGAVYTMNRADTGGWHPEFMFKQVSTDWTRIGTIEDIVLNRSGEIVGIMAEVGGFLGIGDKHVMLGADDVRYAYVTRHDEDAFETMQDVDEGFWN